MLMVVGRFVLSIGGSGRGFYIGNEKLGLNEPPHYITLR